MMGQGSRTSPTNHGLLKSPVSTDVLVLGAGFSKAVSGRFPLTDDLGTSAMALAGVSRDRPFKDGRFEAWLSQLAEPQPYLSQAENTSNLAVFERLVQAIHRVMCEVEREVVADGLPAWVVRLVSALHARRAVLITFNYDRIIERALMELDLHDFDQPSGDHLVSWIDMFGDVPSYPPIPMRFSGGLKATIRLLKLHGSLNWYWVPGDSSGATLHHWELDDDTEGRARYLPGREPFVVPPAATKSAFFRNPIMAETWRRAAGALRAADSVALVGYSLPVADLVAAGMISETVAREGVAVTVVNPAPAPVAESVLRLTGRTAQQCLSVEDFAASYVDSASKDLANQLIDFGTTAPADTLMLVGWNGDLLSRVVHVARNDRGVEVLVAEFDDATPFAPVPDDSTRRAARPLSDLVQQLHLGDTVEAVFAGGSRSTLVGIDRCRTTTGASVNWQILIPADRPQDIGVTSWRQKLGLEAS